MKFVRNHFRQSEFLRNIIHLLTGTFLAQLIPLFAAPFLARIFSPSEFGEYALYMALVSPLSVIAAGRYELAIMLPEEEIEARNLVIVSIIFSFLFNSVLAIIFRLVGDQILFTIGGYQLMNQSKWMLLMPISVFLISCYQISNYWINRKKAFKAIGANKIVQTGSISLFSILFGKFRLLPGLIWGDIIGRLLAALFTFHQIFRMGFRLKHLEWKSLKLISKRYKDFPLFNSWAAMLDSASLNIPVLIVSAGYSAQLTGYFNFARQIIGIPLLMVSMTIAQVYYQRINEKKINGEPLLPLFFGLTKILTLIAIAYVFVILISGESLFSLVFGTKWLLSGFYGKILAFSFAIKFIVSPLLISLPVVNAIKIDSYWKVFYFLSICILYFLVHLDFKIFLLVYTLIEIVVYLTGAIIVYNVLLKFDRRIIN